MSRIFITGINGFIGSLLAKRLIEENHIVSGIVRESSNLKFIEGLDLRLNYGDIRDIDSIKKAVMGSEIVIHAAALTSDWGKYELFYDINFRGTQNVVRTASESGVKRLIHISTAAIYGFGKCNMDETFPFADTNFPYCKTKRMAEEWLFEYAKSNKMEIVSILPANVYGIYDHIFMEKFCKLLLEGKGGFIDSGKHKTCPVYVENLVDAIVISCFHENAAGNSFIISDGLDITWREFTEKLAKELGAPKPKLSVAFPVAYTIAFILEIIYKFIKSDKPPVLTRYRVSNGGKDYTFSIEKARNILGWEPKVQLDEALRRTVEWYKNISKSNAH